MLAVCNESLIQNICSYLAEKDILNLSATGRGQHKQITASLVAAITNGLPELYQRLRCLPQPGEQQISDLISTKILIQILDNINLLLSIVCTDTAIAKLRGVMNYSPPLCTTYDLITVVHNKRTLRYLTAYAVQAHYLITNDLCSFLELRDIINTDPDIAAPLLGDPQAAQRLCNAAQCDTIPQLLAIISNNINVQPPDKHLTTIILNILINHVINVCNLLDEEQLSFNRLIVNEHNAAYDISLASLIRHTNGQHNMLLLLLLQHYNLRNLVITHQVCSFAELMRAANNDQNILFILLNHVPQIRYLINHDDKDPGDEDAITFIKIAETAHQHPKTFERILRNAAEASELINTVDGWNWGKLVALMEKKPYLQVYQLLALSVSQLSDFSSEEEEQCSSSGSRSASPWA